MIHGISDYLLQVFDVSTFVAAVSACLMVFAFWLVRLMTDSLMLSTVYAPVMLLGGLLSNDFFNRQSIIVMQDPDANTALNIAVGIIIAMIVMVVLTRVVYAVGETRARPPA